MDGRFVPHELAENIRDVFLCERTGVLQLRQAGEASLSMEFDRGMLQFIEEDGEEGFGTRLVREGKISGGNLAEALAGGVTQRDLGRFIVERGWMPAEDLPAAATVYMTDLLCRALRWPAGECAFQDQAVAAPPVEADILRTVESFLQAIGAMSGFSSVMRALLALERHLVLKPTAAVPLERLKLTPVQGFLLSRIDGTLSLAEIVSTLPAYEEEQASRFIYGLLLLGAASFDPPVASGPFQTASIMHEHARDHAREQDEIDFIRNRFDSTENSSPYVILGILEGASWVEVQEAYKARKAEVAPIRFLEKVRAQMRSEIRIIEGRLVQAFLALQSSAIPDRLTGREGQGGEGIDFAALAMRREVTKTDVKVNQEEGERQAESHFQKARKYFQQGDYYNCIQYCSQAIKHCENVARFHHLLGEAQVRNPDHRWQKMAEHSFQRAVELDAWNADYLVTLGQFYKRQGLAMRARRKFEKALELLPTHPVAIEELSDLKV